MKYLIDIHKAYLQSKRQAESDKPMDNVALKVGVTTRHLNDYSSRRRDHKHLFGPELRSHEPDFKARDISISSKAS